MARWVAYQIKIHQIGQGPAAKSGTEGLHPGISNPVAREVELLELRQGPAAKGSGEGCNAIVPDPICAEKERLESQLQRPAAKT